MSLFETRNITGDKMGKDMHTKTIGRTKTLYSSEELEINSLRKLGKIPTPFKENTQVMAWIG